MAQNDSADAPGEADEQLKKRARRRLVGAIALVLFAVIVLPMVMDHEPRPSGTEIQVRIPSQDGPAFEGRVASPKPSKSVALAPVGEEKPVAAGAPADDGKAEVKPELKAEPKSEPKPEPKAEAKPVAKESAGNAESVRAAAALAGTTAGEQWVVQLGAYKEAGRVKLLVGKLKELGLPVFTEEVKTPQGARTRVRAGPFTSRDAAVKAQERVKIIGVSGPVATK